MVQHNNKIYYSMISILYDNYNISRGPGAQLRIPTQRRALLGRAPQDWYGHRNAALLPDYVKLSTDIKRFSQTHIHGPTEYS